MKKCFFKSINRNTIINVTGFTEKVKLLFMCLSMPYLVYAQNNNNYEARLESIKCFSITEKQHPDFKKYYELFIEQAIDHFNANSKTFKQRLFIGINDTTAPTVIETEGYVVGKTSKPPFIPNCNAIIAEHRYYGKSAPDSLQWKYLTIKQAANDYHHIRILFGSVFKGAWFSQGISKGGQTALAYSMYFPNDMNATIAYVTPVKNSINDQRFTIRLKQLLLNGSGKKVAAFQHYLLRHKTALLTEFEKLISEKKYEFEDIDHETVFDYMVLEYPFAFFQNCFNTELIPDTISAQATNILEELTTVVSPRFFTKTLRPKLEPSFYMFYHELGYYEYDLTGLKQWLKQPSYPNSIFAPKFTTGNFDNSYLSEINRFIKSKKIKHTIFIYGEHDPYTALGANTEGNSECLKLIVKNGCHKSRIQDLNAKQQQQIYEKLSLWLNQKIN